MTSRRRNASPIFHLLMKDGSSRFLHPFNRPEDVFLLETVEVVGFLGNEPDVSALTAFRNHLYGLIEDGVREWVQENRFVVRFLLSALVFLVSYFVLAFAIRDPLPVVDEAVVAFGLSVATFVLLLRRELRSFEVLERKARLRKKVDGIRFQEHPFLRRVESALWRLEEEGPAALEEAGLLLRDRSETEERLLSDLNAFLRGKFSSFSWKLVRRSLRSYLAGGGAPSRRARKAFQSKDGPLFLLHVAIEEPGGVRGGVNGR
ncbi:hypothetical protein [Spirochaeta thermophila]|uniref:Uncharacterized protein n=1 Tax=Winmispira thermophila (strain ATCC 49972 / DSM 6192 / RI 19.B1) TaxID=665571 RepID=E0RSA8_WINT6|nr:hypothetical protein [Spirochaeta thermophila]ADN01895.1 hypothetical protein STHERM_c09490 [Spirochaeta thermophila DSM 6192]